jgi:hypothetical protein
MTYIATSSTFYYPEGKQHLLSVITARDVFKNVSVLFRHLIRTLAKLPLPTSLHTGNYFSTKNYLS